MTATQIATLPAHIIVINGKVVNPEVSAKHLDELQWYAETEKFDLEAECLKRFGYRSDWLTLAQYSEMMRVIVERRADRIKNTPTHYHYCPGCGAGQLYFDRHCEGKHQQGNIEDECRACREPTNRFYSRRPTF